MTAVLWMVLSVERGALQGFRRYTLVGAEHRRRGRRARSRSRSLLVGVGPRRDRRLPRHARCRSWPSARLCVPLGRRLPAHLPGAPDGHGCATSCAARGAPVAALTLLFVLQELHVIVVKHEVDGDAAGAYAVAAVAAKAIIWVAVGLGLYLLPGDGAALGEPAMDARPILARTLALIAVVRVPDGC